MQMNHFSTKCSCFTFHTNQRNSFFLLCSCIYSTSCILNSCCSLHPLLLLFICTSQPNPEQHRPGTCPWRHGPEGWSPEGTWWPWPRGCSGWWAVKEGNHTEDVWYSRTKIPPRLLSFSVCGCSPWSWRGPHEEWRRAAHSGSADQLSGRLVWSQQIQFQTSQLFRAF